MERHLKFCVVPNKLILDSEELYRGEVARQTVLDVDEDPYRFL